MGEEIRTRTGYLRSGYGKEATEMKRVTVAIAVVGIVCISFLAQAVSAAMPVISVEPSWQKVSPGDEFTVNITVDPEDNKIRGADYILRFNNTLLNATSLTKGDFFTGFTTTTVEKINNTVGIIDYGEAITEDGDGNVTEAGKLTTITFQAIGERGISNLTFETVTLSNSSGYELSNVTVNNGSVEISKPGIANHLVISEVYVNAVNETASEWVELYNPTNSTVNINNWTINTASFQPDATLPTGVAILPYSFYLIGDAGWNPDNSSWHTPDYSEDITLKNEDGWVQLNDSTGAVIDTLGWGSATTNETLSFKSNPSQNQSLQRKISETLNENGYGPAWDTNNNSADFFIQTLPNPRHSGSVPVPPIPELSTLILLFTGLIALIGYALLKRGEMS
ncbi:MAG: lamin tail domain-containing protein [Halobacteriota archaeon]